MIKKKLKLRDEISKGTSMVREGRLDMEVGGFSFCMNSENYCLYIQGKIGTQKSFSLGKPPPDKTILNEKE